MATLEDVRRFIARHADDSTHDLYGRVAKEFDMSREEAERIVEDARGSDNTVADGGDVVASVVPVAAVLGIASSQTSTGSPGNSGPGVAAAALAVAETEDHDDERYPGEGVNSDDTRVERAGWPVGQDRKDWNDPKNERD